MKSFRDFLRQLDRLDWRPAGFVDPRLLGLLADLGRQPHLVCAAVSAWNAKDLEQRQLRCHETATHYKWFVHYHKRLRYRVWLHQYKPSGERRIGHAEVPHNHRYSLASVILEGGFVHHYFERNDSALIELARERQTYARGDAYAIEWQRVHRLSEVRDHTVTLVVESPLVRHFSEAFYSEEGEPSRFCDFIELHPRLSGEMIGLQNAR